MVRNRTYKKEPKSTSKDEKFSIYKENFIW